LTLRVREALTALSEIYYQRLIGNAEALTWFRGKYGIGQETIERLKIGFADSGEPGAARLLLDGPGAFTMRELAQRRHSGRLPRMDSFRLSMAE
jgi:hypothetical protein